MDPIGVDCKVVCHIEEAEDRIPGWLFGSTVLNFLVP